MPTHLRHANVVVPVGNRAVASVCFKADAFQTKGGRKDDGQGEAAQRDDILAVEVLKTWVEFTGTPALERCFVDYCGRQRDDCADVQCAIGPTIETPANSGRDRVIDGRMT